MTWPSVTTSGHAVGCSERLRIQPQRVAKGDFARVVHQQALLQHRVFGEHRHIGGLDSDLGQASRNPNHEGMPAEARTSDWRLPATCFPHDVVAETEQRL